jgi:DNA-binding NtrC family response regulator
MKGTIIITEDSRLQATALESALQQAGATVTPHQSASPGVAAVRVLAIEFPGSDEDLLGVIDKTMDTPRGETGSIPSLDEIERRHITRVLTAAHGNKTLAARILGVDRKTLHRKLSQYARSGADQPGNDVSAHH